MMRSIVRSGVVAAIATGTIAVGGLSAPASAQVGVGNLVNVQITNVANNNKVVVAVPINAAAAICGVTVAVLSQTGSATECDARGNQQVEILQ